MAAPYEHLGLKFIPLGGLTAENLKSYLDSPLVLAAGGSWLATRKMIQQKLWDDITQAALQAGRIVRSSSGRQ